MSTSATRIRAGAIALAAAGLLFRHGSTPSGAVLMTTRTRRLPHDARTCPRVSQPSAPAGGPRHRAQRGCATRRPTPAAAALTCSLGLKKARESDHRTCSLGGNGATHAAHHPAEWRTPS